MKIQIVVAKYLEDINWLNEVKDLCIIYDKSPSDEVNSSYNTIKLDNNLGREADTYLRHILLNYPNFPDFTVFTQGNINDHVNDIHMFIKKLQNIENGSTSLVESYIGLNELRGDNGWGKIKNFQDQTHWGLPLEEWWYRLFNTEPEDNTIVCNYCAIFLVSKENILHHSKEFYQTIHNWVMDKDQHLVSAYVLERLWKSIFDGKLKSILDEN